VTKLIVALCFLILANVFWLCKAAENYSKLARYLAPLNPALRDADNNLTWAIGLLIVENLALIFLFGSTL